MNDYLADIDRQAEEMLFQLVKDYAQRQGITERLKVENQMEWVGRMNCCKAQCRDRIFEKCGITWDRVGKHKKTRFFSGKRGIFNRDGPASGGSILGQLETRASRRSALFFHALDDPGRAQDGGGAVGRMRGGPGAGTLCRSSHTRWSTAEVK